MQDFFGGFRRTQPPKSSQRRVTNFRVRVPQRFRECRNTCRSPSASQGYKSTPAPPTLELPRFKNSLFDQTAGPQESEQARRLIGSGGFKSVQRHILDNAAVER